MIQVSSDGLTEGPETFVINFDATDSDSNNTLLSSVNFVISDDSVSGGLEFGYNDVNNSILLGSPTSSGNIKRYSWNNAGVGMVGPQQSILVQGLNSPADSLTLELIAVDVPGTFYWSNDSNGATNDTQQLNDNPITGIVTSTAWNDTDANNGIIAGDGSIEWTDGSGN